MTGPTWPREHDERRALDRNELAFVVHYEGAFAVWDTHKHVGPMSLEEANVRAYAHNASNGHASHPMLLRVNV